VFIKGCQPKLRENAVLDYKAHIQTLTFQIINEDRYRSSVCPTAPTKLSIAKTNQSWTALRDRSPKNKNVVTLKLGWLDQNVKVCLINMTSIYALIEQKDVSPLWLSQN